MSEALDLDTTPRASDEELIAELGRARNRIRAEIAKRVVGQEGVIDQLLVALFSRGHCLFVGVPGLAKTLLISTLAEALSLSFNRIQFTPDLMPSDITGTDVLEEDHTTGRRAFRFVPGPVFTHVLLADEINRTPPKTQAALLEAMQEGRVTIEGDPHPLPDPFLVVATQNPIEYEGTYPLPEAQLDRFLMKLDVGYPDAEDERRILLLRHRGVAPATLADVQAVLELEALRQVRYEVDSTGVSDEVVDYVTAIVRATRDLPAVELGASPRAGVHMLAASRAHARLDARGFVTPDDVAAVAHDVLRHRLILRPEAELEHYRTDDAVTAVLEAVAVPR